MIRMIMSCQSVVNGVTRLPARHLRRHQVVVTEVRALRHRQNPRHASLTL